jgi:hypothetical protein
MRAPRVLPVFACALLTLQAAAFAPVRAQQMPRIGIVDLYGRKLVAESDVRSALGLRPGDSVSLTKDTMIARLRRVPGVRDAQVTAVCCEAGQLILYVGIQEGVAPGVKFNPAPKGAVRLPESILVADSIESAAMMEGVQKGMAGEDDSNGYSLFEYPPARAAQEPFLKYAKSNAARVRDVLRNSSDSRHRALAAAILPFAGPSNLTISNLTFAMHDADAGVRNNAMRSLAVIAMYARKHPAAKLVVPLGSYADMLNSLVWTDRNKAAFALMQLTESRDQGLLNQLGRNALDPLIDMARWKALGHATPGIIILGRIAGMKDNIIFEAMNRDREVIINAAAAKARRTR